MYKICVCGAFNFGKPNGGGQLVKTRELARELEKEYGSVYHIDTCGKTGVLFLLPRLLVSLCFCKNIIILPAHHAVVLESQLLRWANVLFRRKLIYVVIGGWLQDYLPHHNHTAKALFHFDGIYVETTTMFCALQAMGYKNVKVLPNFKNLEILAVSGLKMSFHEPFPLAMMARVTEKKGTGDAVRIINKINNEVGRSVFSLDIYGPIDKEDEEWFNSLKRSFSDVISYMGVVPYNKTADTLKDYFALLFPTKYYTEGIPGTIIDAYAAGVPVISSKWKSFSDVVEDGRTGIGYEFDNMDAFEDVLRSILKDFNNIIQMRKNCLQKAREFTPSSCVQILEIN